MTSAFLDSDSFFSLHDHLFSSNVSSFATSSSALDKCDDLLQNMTTSGSMLSEEMWKEFEMLPTPPVSPSHDCELKESDEDLDLGLGDILGLDIPGFLTGNDADSEWLFEEIFEETVAQATVADNSSHQHQHHQHHVKCEVGELRHDCMWAGHCPSEEHRLKRELLPSLLSSSPSSDVLVATQLLCPRVERRTRLDTLGSIRPETPLSLSDSELDAELLSSMADSSSDDAAKEGDHSSSSSDDNDDSEEESSPTASTASLPANIQPVRYHIRKLAMNSTKCTSQKSTNSLPDHSYSHSDHSYHTQRKPSDNCVNDLLGIQTPSDSEEEIDVVSLGEVLRLTPAKNASGAATTNCNSAALSSNAPLRLKLKVAPVSSVSATATAQQSTASTVLMRKALPSHPSPLVRQQLQLAVATAAQQRKQSEQQQQQQTQEPQEQPSRKSPLVPELKVSKSSKRARTSSGSCSPRKRSSRTGSDSEDSCEKRSQHNSMERQRRVDLRNAFEFLRSLIPELDGTDRAAKVVILKNASNFCKSLTQRERAFVTEKDSLEKRQEMLRKRLAVLQRRR